jgi:hypothetical protein
MPTFIFIENEKYYKPYDDSDNACCWQVDAVTEDVDKIFDGLGIKREVIPEDWGTAYLWSADGIDLGLQVECADAASCRFKITLFASRKWLLVFSREVPHPENLCPELVSHLQNLNERPSTE